DDEVPVLDGAGRIRHDHHGPRAVVRQVAGDGAEVRTTERPVTGVADHDDVRPGVDDLVAEDVPRVAGEDLALAGHAALPCDLATPVVELRRERTDVLPPLDHPHRD